jgi:hypothetical protein
MANKKIFQDGVDYYNIDNVLITKDNEENIPSNISSIGTEAVASHQLSFSQEVAKPKSIVEAQAPTPTLPCEDTILKMITQIFHNENSTQKHKIKVRLNHTDRTNSEWIATMNKDPRVFRKHNDLELAREWIAKTREIFCEQDGYKTPYYGKFHCHKDENGVIPGNKKEPGCFASMAYNTVDESWYTIIAIYDWIGVYEYDYNFTTRQREQGVKAQLVYTNPKLYSQRNPQTYASRNGLKPNVN